MANGNIPNKMMKSNEGLPPDVRKGDDRYNGYMAQWEAEKRPAMLMVGHTTYQVFQDAETQDFFFRAVDTGSLYSSRSF